MIPRSPAEVFASGQQMAIPMIIGSTTREFAIDRTTPDELRKMIENVTGSLAPKALSLYGLADGGQGTTDPLYGPVGNQWLADFIFRCPVTTQAQWHNAAKHPTYEYQFEHAIPGQEADGAVHSADLPYVFGFYPKSGNIAGKVRQRGFQAGRFDRELLDEFRKRGNPTARGCPTGRNTMDRRRSSNLRKTAVCELGGSACAVRPASRSAEAAYEPIEMTRETG